MDFSTDVHMFLAGMVLSVFQTSLPIWTSAFVQSSLLSSNIGIYFFQLNNNIPSNEGFFRIVEIEIITGRTGQDWALVLDRTCCFEESSLDSGVFAHLATPECWHLGGERC